MKKLNGMTVQIETTKNIIVDVDPTEIFDSLSISEQEEFIRFCLDSIPKDVRQDILLNYT